ncbi:dihydrofolate reductase family protein [Isoptericola aurantiacus]|uniref:dihydrofolate reductase family protein n=1 Tax=Isoptericola aurantiacus TaxID=3377839 RepID=UPI00383B4C7D
MSSATPPLRLLLPHVEDLPVDEAEDRLAALYTADAPRHVRVNMVQSVDGGAWGVDGRSGSINDATDWRVFRVLRALADVVLVGAGTARAEGYAALERPRGLEHLAAAPLELALVTRTGRVPDGVLEADRTPWVVTGEEGAERARQDVDAEHVLVCPEPHVGEPGGVDVTAGIDALAERGLGHVLCEGGPHLLGGLIAAQVLDDLCVTTTPQVVGSGPSRIVAGPAGPAGTQRPATLAHLLAGPSGTLVARWRTTPADRSLPPALAE